MSDPTTTPAESAPRTTPRAAGKSVPIFSIGRVYTIASSTVTQLVRMKTFYFLLAFALVIVAVGNFNIPATPAKELSMIKKVAFGTMDIFAWLFAIVATALLIPKDVEDRTLYTILSKPVRRIEYLLGKLGGVLAVIAISLVAMYAICAVVIFSRESLFVAAEYESMVASGQYTEAEIDEQLSLIQQQGLRAELGIAVLASFFKAAVEKAQAGWRRVAGLAVTQGIPAPAMTSALAYFDGYRCERLPANLLQAQRDYFGAHTYERLDKPRGQFFHTNWTGRGGTTASSTYNV
jgi:hypothetical protein